MSMRIFFAGDHTSGTGPANVTKYYIENLSEGTLYLHSMNKAVRFFEILLCTMRADVVVYSGYSRQNILGLRLAKLFKKPSAYLIHGCVEHENAINRQIDESMNAVERRTMELSDLIIAVSAQFAEWLKKNYPMHADKIDHVTNGIDPALFDTGKPDASRDDKMIFSVGGGMPRKMIKHVCEAVKILREESGTDYRLVVTGDTGADSDEVDAYDFVEDRGIVSFEENARLYGTAALFVQNSSFETFGLAPVEALACGCSVLLSRHIGALEVIKNIEDKDVIRNFDDPNEIASKMRHIINEPNAKRLKEGIDRETYSWKERSEALERMLTRLLQTPS